MALNAKDVVSLGDARVGEATSLHDTDRFPVYAGSLPLEFVQYATLASLILGKGAAVNQFASVAALRASTAAQDIVLVSGYYAPGDGGGGPFARLIGDTTTVDDGAEVIVDAAGRRFKRLWDGAFDFRWCGGVGDGVGAVGTDNSPALNRFCYLARKASAAGKGFHLYVPPGRYLWNATNCGYYWNAGIKKLTFEARHTSWLNVSTDADGNKRRQWPVPTAPLINTTGGTLVGVAPNYPLSWLINNTAVGDTSFFTTTPSDAAAWSAGEEVLLASNDTQFLGYPFNCDQFEYNTVISTNLSTGEVVLKYPIKYQHLTTYPDGGVPAPSSLPCGRGRAWKVSSSVYYVPDPLNFPAVVNLLLPFEIDHHYIGLTIEQTANPPATYMAITGRSMRFTDCVMPGLSPTVAGTVVFDNVEVTDQSEMDKLVERVVLRRVRSKYSIFFQSSSISFLDASECKLAGLGLGTVKYANVTNCDLDGIAFGSIYGMARNVNVIGGTIRGLMAPGASADVIGTPANHIDGTQITYANGVISMPKGATEQTYWGLIKGVQINLSTSGGSFSGDTGTGVVTEIYEDNPGGPAGSVHFKTTWPWASLPAWAGTGVRVVRSGFINVLGTTGCDAVRNLAEAAKRGLKPWEFIRVQLINGTTSGGGVDGILGALTTMDFNVRQASSVSGAKIILGAYLLTDTVFDDQQLLEITIDLTVKGRRKITLDGVTGIVGADAVKFAGSAVTALPAGRFSGGVISWGHNISLPATYGQLPVLTFDMTTNGGMYGDVLVRNLDRLTNPITNVVGLVPA